MKYTLDSRLGKEVYLRRCSLSECQAACCRYGTWVEQDLAAMILANAPVIAQHMRPVCQTRDWFCGEVEPDEHVLTGRVVHTLVTDLTLKDHSEACVFLREDFKCSLQVAAERNAMHPWAWKPFYCILHPLEISEDGTITIPDIHAVLAEKASCLRRSSRKTRLMDTLLPELEYLLGKKEIDKIRKSA